VPPCEHAAPALLRWTLGNLDEAFRSCIAQLESLGEDRGDTDFAVGGRGGVAGEGARFRSCDGPIEHDAPASPIIERASEPDLPRGFGRA